MSGRRAGACEPNRAHRKSKVLGYPGGLDAASASELAARALQAEAANDVGKLREKDGFLELYRYWKPFEAYAVERLLSEHHDCVIDYGAGHSVYEEDALFARVQQVLAPYGNIVLLLPSSDLEESIRILHDRNGAPPPGEFDLNAHFVKHHSNRDLAKIVVYTEGKTPEQTCEEILAAIAIPSQELPSNGTNT